MSQWINGGTPPEKTRLLSLPDVPDTNVGDTISRQAAIDALQGRKRQKEAQAIEAKEAGI